MPTKASTTATTAEKTATQQRPAPTVQATLDQTPATVPANVLQRVAVAPASLRPRDVLALQRRYGNRAVQRLLGGRRAQPKLNVGPANDPYEQEADRVADQALAQSPPVQSAPVQRVGAEGEDAPREPLAASITPLGQGVQRAFAYHEINALFGAHLHKESTPGNVDDSKKGWVGPKLSNGSIVNADATQKDTTNAWVKAKTLDRAPIEGYVREDKLKNVARDVGSKLAPGEEFLDIGTMAVARFKGLLKTENALLTQAVQARSLADARLNLENGMFMIQIFHSVLSWRQKNKQPTPEFKDLTEVEDVIRPFLTSAATFADARSQADAALPNAGTRGRSDLLAGFFDESEAYSRQKALAEGGAPRRSERQYLNQGDVATANSLATAMLSKRNVTIKKKSLSWAQRRKFSQALRSLPTIAYLLKVHKAKQPVVGRTGSEWQNGGLLSSDITESDINDNRQGATDGTIVRTNVDNGEFRRRIDAADQILRLLVEPHLLAQIPRPKVVVHLRSATAYDDADSFRAYEVGNTVHLAQDEVTPTAVHEVGHYLEDNLPSEVWQDIRVMMESRAGDKKRAVHGSSNMHYEGRYAGEYKATGKYTSSAYGGEGGTEVMSMTLQFLADPDKVATMIDKDPQQTAIILRGVMPKEYQATGALRTFDDYLPNT